MVVEEPDIVCGSLHPAKDDAPLFVHADAVESAPAAPERFTDPSIAAGAKQVELASHAKCLQVLDATRRRRPDLLEKAGLSEEDRTYLRRRRCGPEEQRKES